MSSQDIENGRALLNFLMSVNKGGEGFKFNFGMGNPCHKKPNEEKKDKPEVLGLETLFNTIGDLTKSSSTHEKSEKKKEKSDGDANIGCDLEKNIFNQCVKEIMNNLSDNNTSLGKTEKSECTNQMSQPCVQNVPHSTKQVPPKGLKESKEMMELPFDIIENLFEKDSDMFNDLMQVIEKMSLKSKIEIVELFARFIADACSIFKRDI